MANVKVLADNINRYGKAEVTISEATSAKQAEQRAETLRQVLYQRVGAQKMRNVKILIDRSRFKQ